MYTLKHKIAFLKVEKQLTGRNTIHGLLHDFDKVFMYLLFGNTKTVKRLHRKKRKHHVEHWQGKRIPIKWQIQMIVDFECASITKPDKPLNAVQTIDKYYPQLKDEFEATLILLGLIT